MKKIMIFLLAGIQFACASNSVTLLEDTQSFDGKEQYLEIQNSKAININDGDFSVSGWVKTRRRGGIEVIIDKRVETSGPIKGYTVVNYNGKLLLQLANGKGKQWTNYVSSLFIADGQWHHFAITVTRNDVNGIRWYLDGVEDSQVNNPTGRTGSLNNSMPLVIGRRSDSPDWPGYYNGALGNIQLFKFVLDTKQIQALALEEIVDRN